MPVHCLVTSHSRGARCIRRSCVSAAQSAGVLLAEQAGANKSQSNPISEQAVPQKDGRVEWHPFRRNVPLRRAAAAPARYCGYRVVLLLRVAVARILTQSLWSSSGTRTEHWHDYRLVYLRVWECYLVEIKSES